MATRYVDARNGLDVSCDTARPRTHPVWVSFCGRCAHPVAAVSLLAILEAESDHLKAVHGLLNEEEPDL